MSNLSDLLPAGGGAKVAEFVASGTLASGQTVVLKADGTVAAISATGGGEGIGTPVVFEAADSPYVTSTFDSNSNKIVVSYRDDGNSNYGSILLSSILLSSPLLSCGPQSGPLITAGVRPSSTAGRSSCQGSATTRPLPGWGR